MPLALTCGLEAMANLYCQASDSVELIEFQKANYPSNGQLPSVAWSQEHLEDEAERAREKLLKAFHEATGSQVQPIYSTVHRWRFAQATQPLAADCLWDGALGIGACGDWFAAGLDGAGRVENAFLSALAVSSAIGTIGA